MIRSGLPRKTVALLAVLVLIATACGDDDDDPAAVDEETTSTTEEGSTTTEGSTETAEMSVSASEYAFEVPETVPAGATRMALENTGNEPHHAQLFQLNADATMEDLQTQLATGDPFALLQVGTFTGGTGVVDPGGQSRAEAVPVLEESTYALMCFIEDPEGVPHVVKGMLQPFEVTADDAAATSVETEGEIGLVDFGFELPEEISGDGSYEVVNNGEQPHEANIVQLREEATADDVAAFFEGEPQGPPPFRSIGGMQALVPSPTGSQALRLDLDPGRYVLLCLIPDAADGVPHFQKGMIEEVEIS